ncbi:MAG: alpha/beta fold hydrolase [Planctomycetota bacterium]
MRNFRLIFFCLTLDLALGGCAGTIGRAAVKTPNQGKATQELNAHVAEPEMEGAMIDHRLRVEIDQPAASLSVWVIDPSNEEIHDNDQGLWFATPGNKTRKSRQPHSTVLILHGFRHWKNDWAYLVWARFFAQHGYRAVLVDLRGHGGSTGDWSTFGPQEARDLKYVVDELDRQNLLAGNLGVFGGSYGGATAIHFAGIDPRVVSAVTVSAFSTMREVLPSFIKAELGWLSGAVGVWGYDRIVDAAGKAGGFNPEDADARKAMRTTSAHILILHSLADKHVPPQHARDLAYAGGGRVKMVLYEGADHFMFGVNEAQEVRQQALEWFDAYLK